MIVGTAGHIDHGKTALIKALTGVDADRLKEEKERGITIDLGFAYAEIVPDRVTGFVDVPGHERFVHTMLAGASGIDLALLVIAADDGVKPQTREHLAILELIGVRQAIVALTKVDRVDAARRVAAESEARALLAPTSLRTAEIIPVSAITGEGVADLHRRLAEFETALAARSSAGRFRFAVDRSFTLTGAGTIVTGHVLAGAARIGDSLVVSPGGVTARIRSIHAQNRPAEIGLAGQRCAFNLAGLPREAVGRGDMLVDPFLHAPTQVIDARLSLLASEKKPLGQWVAAHLHHASAEAPVRVSALVEPVEPGGAGLVRLALDRPIAAAAGDRFILRDASAQRTIGGGCFLDLRPPRRKRSAPERLAQLAARDAPDVATVFAALLATAPFIVETTAFARDYALSDAQAEELLRPDVMMLEAGGQRFALRAAHWDALRDSVARTLADFHADQPDMQGMGRERLRQRATPSVPVAAFPPLLARLVASGDAAIDGAFVRRPDHVVKLTEKDEELWRRARELLGGEARFRPPRVRDIAQEFGADESDVRRILRLCARLGRVDQIAHDHFFLRATTDEMARIAFDVSRMSENDGWFVAASFRDRMNNGRKVAIQILDFFDRNGLTIRRGDLRRFDPRRLDAFSAGL